MSCEHPIRVFNKYTNEYVWVSCGKCNTCQNRRASEWTQRCECERKASLVSFFVTLTYDEPSKPVYTFTGGFDKIGIDSDNYLRPSRERDIDCIHITRELFDSQADKELFYGLLVRGGIPYASRTDIQLFHKRLNKYFKQNVTNKYQNFRYFLVSEYGSTTLRPHFHGIYFVNDSNVAKRFLEGVSVSWKYGRIDVQCVQKSACSYVAQYVNKFASMPSFYQKSPLRPFILCSRNPFIGTVNQYTQSDKEIFDSGVSEVCIYREKDNRLDVVSLDKASENRLFPKCSSYYSLSHYERIELYSVCIRFPFAFNFKEFASEVRNLLRLDYDLKGIRSSFLDMLYYKVDNFSLEGENWLRRVYYLSRKVLRKAKEFGYSVTAYVRKIEEYWNNKEELLLRKFYEYQEAYMQDIRACVDDLSICYPEFVFAVHGDYNSYVNSIDAYDVIQQRASSRFYNRSNKLTHFKNLYLDSLKDKDNRFYSLLKNFYHAKKCYEIVETLAS